MPVKIYFGNAIVTDTRTRTTHTLKGLVFTDNCHPQSEATRTQILKGLKEKDRPAYQITKLCFDSAKVIGETIK